MSNLDRRSEAVAQRDWISSPIRDHDLLHPITCARHALAGQSDAQIKALWRRIQEQLENWAEAHHLSSDGQISFPISHGEWRYSDCTDMVSDLHKVSEYAPMSDLFTELTPQVGYAVLMLAESMAGSYGPNRLAHKISALKALPLFLAEQYGFEFHSRVQQAARETISQSATAAAQARHSANRRLKEKALELYLEHKTPGRSKHRVAELITPLVQAYGRDQLGHYLTGGNPTERIYRWICEAHPSH